MFEYILEHFSKDSSFINKIDELSTYLDEQNLDISEKCKIIREVYDYNKAINDAETYYKNNPNEFKNSDGGIDEEKYMDYKIKKMEAVKDKIKYTLNLTLTKKDKKWVLNDISESDRQKLHGLYNS